MNRSVLIISYTFPPYPGIGGRRWAKFAKYLAKKGYSVHVISAANPFKISSLYLDDVKHGDIKLHTFKSNFPTVLQNVELHSLIDKLRYKFWMKFLPFFIKGYIYDKAIFDRRKVLSLAAEVIKLNSIKNVITTGAPFRLNYYSLALKKLFPEINLIQDLRDPWTWGAQYRELSDTKKKYEEDMLTKVIEQSNLVTVPVELLKDHLVSNFSAYSDKIRVLPHAFDDEEIFEKTSYSNESFRLVFFGTMYSGSEHYFDALFKIVSQHNGKVTLNIFTEHARFQSIAKKNQATDWVKYHTPLSGNLLYKNLSEHDFVVMIYPIYLKDYLSTKFYEIIRCKIPIIFIGEHGIVSDFISTHKLGIHLSEESLTRDLNKLLKGEIKLDYNTNFYIEEYSFTKVTEKLTGFLI